MLLVLLSLVIIVGAVFATRAAESWMARARQRAEEHDRGLLEAAGFTVLDSAPTSFRAEASVGGKKLRIQRGSVPLPGRDDDESPSPSVVTLLLPEAGPDLLACRVSDADAVFGPLPTAPKVPTGHASFDASYEVRGAQLDVAQSLLEALLTLDLHFLRRRDGLLEVHLRRCEPRFSAPWMDLAVALATRGEATGFRDCARLSLRRPADEPPPSPPDPSIPLYGAWLACLALVPIGAILLLGLFAPVRSALADLGCASGELSASSVNDSFTMVCAGGSEASGLVFAGACALSAALTLSVGMLLAARRVLAHQPSP